MESSPPNSAHFTEQWLFYFYHMPRSSNGTSNLKSISLASPWQSHGVPASIISSVGMTPVYSQSFFLCVSLKSQVSLKIPPSRHATFCIPFFFLSSTDLVSHLEDITYTVCPDCHDYLRWHHCLVLHSLIIFTSCYSILRSKLVLKNTSGTKSLQIAVFEITERRTHVLTRLYSLKDFLCFTIF